MKKKSFQGPLYLELFNFLSSTFLSYQDISLNSNRYGIEQEYTLLQKDVNWPIGWPVGGYPGPQARKLLLKIITSSAFVFCKLYKTSYWM